MLDAFIDFLLLFGLITGAGIVSLAALLLVVIVTLMITSKK